MCIALFFASSLMSLAHTGDQSDGSIETIKVADQIYMLVGQGGNIGLAINNDYAVMIDNQFAPLSDAIQEEIAKLTDKPVQYLINTHFHFDHTDGNANFSDFVGTIVAHENTRNRLKEGCMIEAFGKKMEPYSEPALPILTYTEKLSIYNSDESVELIHFASAHTDGDTVVHFKSSNVIHAGDLLFSGMYPFIDIGNGGDVHSFIAAQKALLALANYQTVIIPGHGLLSNKVKMERDLTVLESIVATVESGIVKGITLKEVIADSTIQSYAPDYGQGILSTEKFIGILYEGLK